MSRTPPLDRLLTAGLLGLLALLQPAKAALGQGDVDHRAAPKASVVIDRRELEGWLDGYLGLALRVGNVAGAVVVVVQDGRTVLAKGYGYADVATRTPVDPERTGFRPGSVSKLFTATAVMQLVEQGKLDLDRDANDYLDFVLPPAFSAPITLRNMLTHRPGLGQIVKGLGTNDSTKVESLEYHVKHHIPPRIYPPGTIPAYSNYGLVLAGYIVQRVSGERFEDYIERHIFRPLGMNRSTFRQPLPAGLRADMSSGYRTAAGSPQPFEILGTMPAGGLTSPAADMARFMIAHLQDGRLDSARILRPETARLMHGRATSDHPELNGMVLGFRESSRNGQRIIGHGGDTQVFHADLELYLDAGVGLFVAFNSLGVLPMDANTLIGVLVDDFTDHYFPVPRPVTPPAVATAAEHARMAAGSYLSSRHFERGFLALFNLLQIKVSANEDMTISISSERRADGRPKVWRETGPFQWQEVDGQDRLAMIVENGRVVAILRSGDPANALVPVPGWMNPKWILPALAASILVLLATALARPLSAVARRLAGQPAQSAGGGRLLRLGAWAALAFLLGWVLILRRAAAGEAAVYTGGLDRWIRLLHVLGLLTMAGAGLALGNAWRTLRSGNNWGVRLRSVLLAGAGLYVVWFAIAFHLLTVNLDY